MKSIKQDPKVLFFLVPFVFAVYVLAKIQEVSPIDFSAHGRIIEINWNGPNHGLPYLLIKRYDNGRDIKLETNELVLSEKQIQIGDDFKKISGSKLCDVNGVQLQCIK